jgi:hypothetical protein
MSGNYPRISADEPWVAPPLVPGDWRELSAGESAMLVLRLSYFTRHPVARTFFLRFWPLKVRAMRPRFYPGWVLAEIQTAQPDGRRGLCNFLYGTAGGVLLDSTSAPVHRANGSKVLALAAPGAAADYLRFFCAAVHGEEGPFRIVESIQEVQARTMEGQGASSIDPADAAEVRPIVITPRDGGFSAAASLLYGPGLFRAVFAIDAEGTIEMLEDTQVSALRLRPEEYRGPFRLYPPAERDSTASNGGEQDESR